MIRAGRRRGGAQAARSAIALVVAGLLATCIVTSTALAAEETRSLSTSRHAAGVTTDPEIPAANVTGSDARIAFELSSENDHQAETGASERRRLPLLYVGEGRTVTRLVAVPRSGGAVVSSVTLTTDGASVELEGADARAIARVSEMAMLRDQAVALLEIDAEAARRACGANAATIEIGLSAIDANGPVSVDAGPFTRAASSCIVNYGFDSPQILRGSDVTPGVVSYIESLNDLTRSGPDILYIVAGDLAAAPAVYALANHHASYLGLNVGIASTAALVELTPEDLKMFITAVYESQSAAHFTDGHLGFVLLIGDAFTDDNQSVMVPKYDGYGGTEEASDHYFACVSGDDDIEDLMIGRLSVGNLTELNNVVSKISTYSPKNAAETWHDRTLLVGGLFYTIKDDYVSLFDEYEELIPDDKPVSRIYRHDFGTVQACAEAVADAINDGYLIVNFAGDGWLSEWHETFRTTHIDLLDNPTRLPIVLSMACVTGWFDNTTEVDAGGSYDCLAEQLVNAQGKGAIACLAAPRASDGGMFRSFTKEIYRAVFEENSVFLGEAVAVAKLLHIQNGGNVDYARQFNLFGDPTIMFDSEDTPSSKPDLVCSPHLSSWLPEYPAAGGDLQVSLTIKNQSNCDTENVCVRVSGETLYDSYSYDSYIDALPAWSSSVVTLTIPALAAGAHGIDVTVDPGAAIDETNEANNTFSRDVYAYQHVSGFPLDTGESLHTSSAARLGDELRVLVMNENAQALAVSPSGQLLWQSRPYTDAVDTGYEISPSIGDLDGDGVSEVIVIKRMGVTLVDANGSELWSIICDDPVGYPVVADADGDGDGDVVVLTKNYMWNTSSLIALDEYGSTIWTYQLPGTAMASTFPIAGDFDCDGHADFAFGTSDGEVIAVSTSETPPAEMWAPIRVSTRAITAMASGDLDADGNIDLVVGADLLACVRATDGAMMWTFVPDDDVVSLALGDLDGDDTTTVLAGTADGLLTAVTSGSVDWSTSLSGVPGTSASVADVDGDGALDIVVGTSGGYVHVLAADGMQSSDPMPIPGGVGTPYVCDLNSDGANEIVLASFDGMVMAFGLSNSPTERPEWSGLGGNARHDGLIAQPMHGTILQDRLLDGRYTVTAGLTVSPSATLSIMPGTELEFLSDGRYAALSVQGGIVSSGTAGVPVRFYADSAESPDAAWQGIELSPGATASLTHTTISGAAVGLSGQQAAVTIQDCLIDGCGTGLHLDSSLVSVTRVNIVDCTEFGAYLDGGSGEFVECILDSNGVAGAEVRGGAQVSFDSTTFASTTAGHGVSVYGSSPSFSSCVFEDNGASGAFVQNSNPEFFACTFSDNAYAGLSCKKTACPMVGSSSFTDNYAGVIAESSSRPNLGNEMFPEKSGGNSFVGNSIAVWNNTSTTTPIYAKGNWWGTSTPYGRIFIGYVIYRPWLTEPPTDNLPKDTEVGWEGAPVAFGLSQNAPNPFNPTTFIRYNVPAPGGNVDLLIYDAAGRLVSTLRSGYQSPGTHEAVWHGRDDRNREVASGVYFVRMVAPDFSSSRKMLLLK